MKLFSLVFSSIIVALLMAGSASAASFNCGKAITAYERALCASPSLSELDEHLAVAYNQARNGLGQGGRDAVLSGQREWIRFAERACTRDAEPLRGVYDEDGYYCLESVLRQRIDALSFPNQVGRYAAYEVHRYRAVNDVEFEDWSQAGQKSLSYPVFVGGDGADAINAAILEIVNPYLSDFNDGAEIDGYTDDDVSVNIEAVTPYRISFSQSYYSYGHGAAHGNYSVNYLHFLTQERRILREVDIFADANWPDVVMPGIIASLEAELGDFLWLDDLLDAKGNLVNPDRWIFSPDGLGFQFQPYEVAPYAAGAPIAQVPWEALAGVLSRNALAIAGVQ